MTQASYDVLQYAAWPASLARADSYLHTSPAGGLRLLSTDGLAWAELAEHRQTLTSCHLMRLHREGEEREEGVSEDGGNGGASLTLSVSEDGGGRCGGEGGGGGERKRKLYVWTTSVHSTAAVPECWRHALSLLLQYKGHLNGTHPNSGTQCVSAWSAPGQGVITQPILLRYGPACWRIVGHCVEAVCCDMLFMPSSSGVSCKDSNKENNRADAVVSAPLPHSLPLACHSPHLHHPLNHSQVRTCPAPSPAPS